MRCICFTWFPIGGLGEPKLYQNLGCFTRTWDFEWRVSDCEELVGVTQYVCVVGFFLRSLAAIVSESIRLKI